MNIFDRTARYMEKRSILNFAVMGSRALLAPIVRTAVKSPLKSLGIALTGAEVAGSGRNAAKVSQGLRNSYHNFEQAQQHIGQTF